MFFNTLKNHIFREDGNFGKNTSINARLMCTTEFFFSYILIHKNTTKTHQNSNKTQPNPNRPQIEVSRGRPRQPAPACSPKPRTASQRRCRAPSLPREGGRRRADGRGIGSGRGRGGRARERRTGTSPDPSAGKIGGTAPANRFPAALLGSTQPPGTTEPPSPP